MASLHFASWAVIPVLITITMITVAGSIHPRLTRPTFFIATGILLSFYLIDAIVMFKTGLRLTYNTLDWVLGLSRLSSLAGTIGSMNGIGTIMLLFFAPPLVFRYSMQISASKDAIARLAPFLLFALATSLSCQFFGVISPGLFKDPVMVMFSSFASLTADRNSFKSFEELTRSFKECGLTTLTYDKPIREPDQTAAKKNLILIMLESTTNRYVSLFGHHEQTWPELEKYKDRMEIFPFFFSCFPESSNADFALMSGLYPPDFLLLRQRPEIPAKLLVDHFKEAGYDCSLLFSGFLGDTGLSSFYKPRGFDRIYDAGNMPGVGREEGWLWGVKEQYVVNCINDLLSRQESSPAQPFFIYYRMLFPHAPFQSLADTPPVFDEEGYQQGNLVGRFKNCLLYQDAQIARILKHLDSTGLASSTIVILVSDHGTMLGENGRLGHGWSLQPELTNVPLVLIRPEASGIRTNLSMGSHVDVLPTALAVTGLQMAPGTICQGRSLIAEDGLGSTGPSARIFLHSMSQTALVENGYYYWFPSADAGPPEIFSISQSNGKTEFSKVSEPLTVLNGDIAAQSRKFLALQKSLLLNLR
jgi:membrane-anchored protein YejM (alkaline phosphatase superfamily)